MNNVQDTHISEQLTQLHAALLEIVAVINRPQQDEVMVKAAGIPLDGALFPLLVLIERLGPIGVVELAERIGRDYTTVSRQAAKLETIGLITRRPNASDGRLRQAVVTPTGKVMTNKVDEARDRMGRAIFKTWDRNETTEFVRLMQKFADALSVSRDVGSIPGD